MEKTNRTWNSIVDFHTHLLPAIDDGSASAEETDLLLAAQKEQGIGAVIATPHFYTEEGQLEDFLSRRAQACEKLRSVYDPMRHPTVYLGAEVAFFSGIGHSRLVERLTVEGTNAILVEMPFRRWSDYEIEELAALREGMGLIPIVAHIERYEKYQKHKTVERLVERGVLFQANAEHFLDAKTEKRAIKDFLRGKIALLGSDCHNLTHRVPNLSNALSLICEYRDGEDAIEEMRMLQDFLLKNAKPIEK
ncbi:MAG: capsular polysaccharide biosynthesis protein [Clostridia bacterium]|nr:capsular polysaccharide biosynthesis protein [Clostridia bacterium]